MSAPYATVAPNGPVVNYIQKAQDYELPRCVKQTLNADVQQANAIAIVMALFAGALVSLAQIVGTESGNGDTDTPSWGALRVFLYSAIMLNLGGAFLSLITIKMCSDLPLAAQQRLLVEGSPASTHPLSIVARGETLPQRLLEDHFGLLESFGMSQYYRSVDQMSSWILIAACVCTFAALMFWIFLSENVITAGLTMIVYGPVAIIVVGVFLLASMGQGWR